MNPKLIIISRLLTLSLLFFFISCTDELYNTKELHTSVDKNKISLAQFKKETTIAALKPIVSAPKTTSITSKGKLQLNDFIIDTLAIKKFIAKNNQTTYTFRIYPLSFVAQPNEIYNLVYRKVNTSWETVIFYLKKFPKENNEHKLFEKIERIDVAKVTNAVTSKSTLTTSNSGSGMCSYETLTIECDGSCDRQGYSECDGFACPTGQCVERSITYMYCNLEDYSGGGGSGGTYAGTGGSEGGGNGSTNYGVPTGNSALEPFTYFPNDLGSPVYEDPMYVNTIKRAYIWDNLREDMQRFYNNNQDYMNYFNETIRYQINLNWSAESNEMGNWAREYKYNNPNTSWSQFQNWFMGTSEGQDGEYDTSFWENPNLTFQQQNLPTYNDYVNNMARSSDGKLMKGADNIFGLVGGKVLDLRKKDKANTENTCALKVSIALNRTNIIIPNIPGQTIEGGGEFSGKYFFLNAKSLNSWMRKTFGTNKTNHIELLGTEGGINGEKFTKSEKLKNIKGIYSMITTEQYDNDGGASGHADLLFYDSEGMANCAFGCFFNLPVKRIDVWILN
jgi:Type VI secretion system (T6SS), amidase effector protein 4